MGILTESYIAMHCTLLSESVSYILWWPESLTTTVATCS